jgi:type VI secretion system protein ImpC
MARKTPLEQWIQQALSAHLEPGTDPRQAELVESVDQAIAAQMRTLLHHPDFQRLEATWRSLADLVNGTETGTEVRIHAIDVDRGELLADVLGSRADLSQAGLHHKIRDLCGGPDGEPLTLLVTDLEYSGSPDDTILFAGLGSIAAQNGAALLASAGSEVLGHPNAPSARDPKSWAPSEDVAARWQALRALQCAASIGLFHPRLLLRLPFGKKAEPVERFAFEEFGLRHHEHFLWGSAAFAAARLLAAAFLETGGWEQPGPAVDIEDLPAYTFVDDDGEPQLMPCAEVFYSEAAAEALLAQGLVPVVSFRNRNIARIVRFHSIAAEPTPLAGPWSG